MADAFSPECFTVKTPEGRWIQGIIVLHRAGVARKIQCCRATPFGLSRAGPQVPPRDDGYQTHADASKDQHAAGLAKQFALQSAKQCGSPRERRARGCPHETSMRVLVWASRPSSSFQMTVKTPLSVAIVLN